MKKLSKITRLKLELAETRDKYQKMSGLVREHEAKLDTINKIIGMKERYEGYQDIISKVVSLVTRLETYEGVEISSGDQAQHEIERLFFLVRVLSGDKTLEIEVKDRVEKMLSAGMELKNPNQPWR